MVTSFRSSKDIIKESESLFSRLDGDYWAHIDGRNPTESLLEHSRLVADYLEKIIEAHDIENVINNIIDRLCQSIFFKSPEKAGNLVKELFINSIFLHDLGKVNPNFQVERMKNNVFKSSPKKIKHHHSFLGAYIFCNHYFKAIFDLSNLSDDEKTTLYFVTFCLANPIIRHHSSYVDFTRDFDVKANELSECFKYLAKYQMQMDESFCSSFFTQYEALEDIFIQAFSEDVTLHIYVLIKLSFSLLTASDFYATNEFMANIVVSEFGLIKDELRKKIKDNFWSLKSYNADLLSCFDHYLSIPFNDLHEISNENLNILRQKMTAEVISTLRNNVDNHWYYLEAPTGAGKTNLSLV